MSARPSDEGANGAGARVDVTRRAGRLRPITLRTKLIGGFVIAIVALSAIIGVFTQVFLSQFLTAQLDRQVQGTTTRLAGPPPNDTGQQRDPGAGHGGFSPSDQLCSTATDADARGGRQPDGSVFAVIDRSGSTTTVLAAVRGQYPSCTELPAATANVLADVPADGRIVTVTLGGFGDYRVVSRGTSEGAIVSGLSTAGVDATQQRLLVILLIVTGCTVLLGGLAVWWSVRRSLRPLEQVAATARQVTTLPLRHGEVDLSVRVPHALTDPRTEVGQVGAALDQMLAHVEDALTARQQSESRVRRFVADASHELRTPLTAIRGYAELAGRSPDDLVVVRHALGRVHAESARMTALVDDLLLLARLDAGRPLGQDPVDLSQLAIDAVSDARVAGPQHRWRLDLPAEPIVLTGDVPRLHQVLANLLANARSHTRPGTTVLTALRTEAGMAILTVTDDGAGIPADLQPEIFGRFVRGEPSRSRTAGSTGLGLAIVAAVVAAHHGTVQVQSRPGRTVFTVRLPLPSDLPS
jgi:two-component system OmpR family sensor kinase